MNDRDKWVPKSGTRYSNYLSRQREKRKALVREHRKSRLKRRSLTTKQRSEILEKTSSRCHICGGEISGKWQADHVLSHSKGGEHLVDNYLAAHDTCNNYRWHYIPEEFREILRLGVWAQTQIVKKTQIGNDISEKFVKYELGRIKRRKIQD